MIRSLHIQNFRCFRDARVSGLRRINVLVGRNASGKTSVLEAVYLVSGGNPDAALRLRAFRGMVAAMQVQADRDSFEDLWRDLFIGMDATKKITIQAEGSPALARTLEIEFRGQGGVVVPLSASAASDPRLVAPLTLTWRMGGGAESRVEVTLGPGGLVFSSAGDRTSAVAYIPPGILFNSVENARQYSRLSKAGKAAEVRDAVAKEYPLIEDLSVEDSGGSPVLYAQVGGLERKLPLGVVSEGVNRFTALAVAGATLEHGVLCIDEVASGIYFDRVPELWRMLLRFAERHDLQVFASTHSQECLAALRPAVEENESAFALLRAERDGGEFRVRPFDGAQLLAAVEEQVEVR